MKSTRASSAIEDLKGKTVSIGAPNSRHRGDRAAADEGRRPRSRQGRDAALAGRGGVHRRRCARARSTRSCGPAACRPARSPTSRRPTRSCCCRWTPTCPSSTSATARPTRRPRSRRASTRASPPVKTIAVPNLLMVREDMDEALAHDLIKLMFDHKKELAEVHPWAEKLTLEDAQKIVEPVSSCTRAPSATTGGGEVRRRARARLALVAGRLRRSAPRSWRATATAAWSPRPRCRRTGASRSPTATRSTRRPPRSASAPRAAASCSTASPRRAPR